MLPELIASLVLIVNPIKPWIAAIPMVAEHDMKAHVVIVGKYYTRKECQAAVEKFNQILIQNNYVIKLDDELAAASPKHLARCVTDMVED